MSDPQLNKDRREALKLALSSVAAIPLSSLMLHGHAHAADLPPLSEDGEIEL